MMSFTVEIVEISITKGYEARVLLAGECIATARDYYPGDAAGQAVTEAYNKVGYN